MLILILIFTRESERTMEQLAETQSAILMKTYINEVADHKCHRLAGNEDAQTVKDLWLALSRKSKKHVGV